MSLRTQTQNNTDMLVVTGLRTRAAQRLTPANWTISHVGFMLRKETVGGAPAATGNVTFAIRKVSDDSIIASKVWGDISTLTTSDAWCAVALDSPISVNEEVRISCEFSGGTYTSGAYYSGLIVRYQNTDVAASENLCWYTTSWQQTPATFDATYYLTYTANPVSTVATLTMTDVEASTATGNGRIEAFGVDGAVTQHGHCWSTSANPTTADTKTTLGVKSTLGAFTSSLTSLTPGTTYHVRAYVTDSVSTYYGADVPFTAGQPTSSELTGRIAVVGTRFHYVDRDGIERYLEGTVA